MTFQPGAVVNTQGFGNKAENLEVPFISDREPFLSDNKFPVGKRWIQEGIAEFVLLSYSIDKTTAPPSLVPNWALIVNDTISPFVSLSDDANNRAYPTSPTALPYAGNVQLKGDGISIATTTSDNTITISGIGPGSQSLTGDDAVAVEPIGGTIVLTGDVVANATHGKAVFTTSPGTNIENIEVQVGASIASTDITKVGLVAFDQKLFTTDSNGFVTAASGTVPLLDGQIAIGKTGFAPVASLPTNGTNISWTGGPGTLQANLSGNISVSQGGTGTTTLANHGVLIGHGSAAVAGVTLGDGQVLVGNSGGSGDPTAATVTGTNGISVDATAGAIALSNVNIPNSALANSFIRFEAGTNTSIQGGNQNVPLGGTVQINADTTSIAVNVTNLTFTPSNNTYFCTDSDYSIFVDTTGYFGAVFLPSPATLGRIIQVKKIDVSFNFFTVRDNITFKSIDNLPEFSVTLPYGSASFIYNGTMWCVF